MQCIILLEYSDNYSETLGSLFHYDRDEPVLYSNDVNVDFTNDNTTESFKFQEKKQVRQEIMAQRILKNYTI